MDRINAALTVEHEASLQRAATSEEEMQTQMLDALRLQEQLRLQSPPGNATR